MRANVKIDQELLTSIDVLNTLQGGISEPQLKLIQHQDFREIQLCAPGVREENMRVEIRNNFLNVFYLIELESNHQLVSIPKVVYSKAIPYFIDASKINASYQDGLLSVKLPFNELSDGYHQRIAINH